MKKLLNAVLLSVCGLATSANASLYTIGELPTSPATYSHTASVTGSSFSDTYVFTVSSDAETASASAVSLSLLSVLNIDNLTLSLLSSTGAVLASASSGDYATLSDYELTEGLSYSYLVTGDITGAAGGVYTLLATSADTSTDQEGQSANVPEPAGLMLSGIGLLAAGCTSRGRLRRRSVVQA